MPPIDLVLDALLHVVLPPALIAVAVMATACLLSKWHPSIVLIGSAIAIAAGLALGCSIDALGCSIDQRLPWRPEAFGWQWLLPAVLAAVAIDAVARLPRVSTDIAWALRGLLSAQLGWLLSTPNLREEHPWAPFALGAVVLLEWAVLEQVGRLDRRGLVALAMAVAANVAALVLIYAATARFGDVALVLMAVLGGVALPPLLLGREANGVAAAVAVLLPGLLLSGQQLTSVEEMPLACFALVALSPLALAPSLLPAWRSYQKKGLWAVQALLVLLPLAVAIYLAAQTGTLDFE